jgi:hypothetical protein
MYHQGVKLINIPIKKYISLNLDYMNVCFYQKNQMLNNIVIKLNNISNKFDLTLNNNKMNKHFNNKFNKYNKIPIILYKIN